MRFQYDFKFTYFLIIIINSIQNYATLSLQKKWALLNVTTYSISDNSEPLRNILFTDSALYSLYSPVYTVSGQIIDVQNVEIGINSSNVTISNMGCSDYINDNLPKNYVALVSRGVCTFERKVQIAISNKASAIIIYNNDVDVITMYIKNTTIPSIMVSENVGSLFRKLIGYSTVYVTIKPGPVEFVQNTSLPSKSSIYFVAFAFLSVVLVTFIWLTVYYVQKFRYLNTKKRLDDKLKKATLKALSKMVVRKISNQDKELTETCAICLENYQINDLIRQLPCGHYFHQKDVDVWLLEHRNCPMCKLNILQACGIEFQRPENRFRRYINNLGIRRVFHSSSIVQAGSAAENTPSQDLNLNVISTSTNVNHFQIEPTRSEIETGETIETNESETSDSETNTKIHSTNAKANQDTIMVTSVTSSEQNENDVNHSSDKNKANV